VVENVKGYAVQQFASLFAGESWICNDLSCNNQYASVSVRNVSLYNITTPTAITVGIRKFNAATSRATITIANVFVEANN
jgi:hypothetical protein